MQRRRLTMDTRTIFTAALAVVFAGGAASIADAQTTLPRPQQIGGDAPAGVDPGRRFAQPPAIPDAVTNRAVFGDPAVLNQDYSLPELLELAAANNPTLLQARYQITAQLATAQEAGLYPNPTVSAVNEQLFIKDIYAEYAVLEIEQRIVTAGKLQLSRDKYLQRAKVAEHLAVAQQFRVCNDVRVHFYRILAADERIRLHRELVKSAEDGLKTAREELNLGQTNEAGIRQSNIALQRARLNLLTQENDRRRHVAELSALVGCDLSGAVFSGDLTPPDIIPNFDAEYARIVSSSPEVLAAHAKLREDHITLRREEVEPIPDVTIGAGPGYNFDANDTIANAFVRVEIPLFDRNQGNIKKAKVDINRQQLEVTRTELDLKRRLADQFAILATALSGAFEYEQSILPDSKSTYRMKLEAYKDNRIDWADVLRAQVDYTQSRLELVDRQLTARTSMTMIGGYLLSGGLNPADSPIPAGHMDSTPNPR